MPFPCWPEPFRPQWGKKTSTPTGPARLTFTELGRGGPEIPAPLKAQTDGLFSTSFVEKIFIEPVKPAKSGALGSFIRMAEWNIERGINFEMIQAVFSGAEAFDRYIDEKKFPRDSDKRRVLLEQAEYLKAADVFVLNEVDRGMKGSDYRHVSRELAWSLKMNLARSTFVAKLERFVANQSRRQRHDGTSFRAVSLPNRKGYRHGHSQSVFEIGVYFIPLGPQPNPADGIASYDAHFYRRSRR